MRFIKTWPRKGLIRINTDQSRKEEVGDTKLHIVFLFGPHSEIDIQPKVPLVTPVAAVEERTKDELEKNIREGNPHIDPQNGIKRKVRQRVHIPSKKLKGSTTLTGYKERSKKKPVTKRQSKKLPNKSTKRSQSVNKGRKNKEYKTLSVDQYRSVFE